MEENENERRREHCCCRTLGCLDGGDDPLSQSCMYRGWGGIGAPIALSDPNVNRAHVDGGSLATSTDSLDLLWHVTSFAPCKPPARKVADAYQDFPWAVGYLLLPSWMAMGIGR